MVATHTLDKRHQRTRALRDESSQISMAKNSTILKHHRILQPRLLYVDDQTWMKKEILGVMNNMRLWLEGFPRFDTLVFNQLRQHVFLILQDKLAVLFIEVVNSVSAT